MMVEQNMTEPLGIANMRRLQATLVLSVEVLVVQEM